MTPKNRMTKEEYKDELAKLHRSGETGASRKNYEKTNALKQTVLALRGIQRHCAPIVFDSLYRLNIEVHGKTRADEDNIRKAINDALQGVATRNDRYSRGGAITLCDS